MISIMNSNDIDLDRKPRGSEEKDVVFDSSDEKTRVWHGGDFNSSGSNGIRFSKDKGSIKGEKVSVLDGNVESGDRLVEEMGSVDVDLKDIDEKIKKDDQFSDENGGTERLELGVRSWEDTEANTSAFKSQVSVRNGKNDKLVSRAKKGHVKGEKSSVSQYDSMLSMFDEFAANGRGGELEENPPGYGYEIGDMVWGKVKSHPWWPGHIYSENFASPTVRRSKTEGHVLVAFFGDSSYGWFDPAELIPFDYSFSEKSRQTSSRTFVKAVEEAVDEANRRRALGLACRCRNPYNFRVTDVQGCFAVDVGDYEPGTIYSVDQIRKARESFQPREMLAFIKQLALSPISNEHGSIHFMKNKATVLAYRKAAFEEFDETYAQAFGHQPVRPSRQTQDMCPTRAPLSGPLVIAEALGKAKGFARPNKSKDLAKKDRYLFKRRGEPNELKTSIQINSGQATSSGQPVYVDGSLAVASGDYVLQKRSPLISTNHEVPEKHERAETLAGDSVSDLSHQRTGKEGMTIDEKPAVVEFSMGEAPGQFSHPLEARSSLGMGKDVGRIGQNASDSVGDMPCTVERSGVPIDIKDHASSTAFKSAESFEQSFSQAAEIELHGEQGQDGFAASHPLGTANAKVHGEGPKVHTDIATKKAKIRKRPAGELNSENSIPLVKKKKKKQNKELVSSQNMQIRPSGGKARSSVGNIPGNSVHVSLAAREDFQVDRLKKGDTVTTSFSADSSVAQKMAQMEELELPQLLHDLQVLALDPFHNAERSTGAVTQDVFLRFRSLVYQKSLASLPTVDSESNESRASKPQAIATANIPSAESVTLPSFKPQRPVVRPDDPTKGGRKRGPSDRQEEIAAKKKKKINDMKVLTADKKAAQKTSALPRGDIKETSGPTIKSVKQEPLKKPEPPSRAPEPTMLVMKFPPQGTLPSIMELKARFARFGQMDHSATRIFWKSLTCRVVYRHKADAQSAYRFAVGSSNLFGNTGVRCFLRELGAPETEPGKTQREDSLMGTSQARDFAVERRPAAPLQPQAQQQPPGVQLKSILKKSTGDETSGNGGGRGTPRVKFMLGGEENSRGGEELMIGNKNFNNNASFAEDGASSTSHHGMDFNSKNIVITPSPSPLLPLPTTTAVQFPRPPNNLHYTEIAPPGNAHNFNIPAAPPMIHSAPNVDISQQMISLLTKCNDVVTNLTAYLGYVPYRPL